MGTTFFIKILEIAISTLAQVFIRGVITFLIFCTRLLHIITLCLIEALKQPSICRCVHGELISLMPLHRLFVQDDSHHTSLELHLWFDSPFQRYVDNPIQIQPYPPVNLFSHCRRSQASLTGSCLRSRMCANLFQCVCSVALLHLHQTLDPLQVMTCTSLHQATRTSMCALRDNFMCMQYQSINLCTQLVMQLLST